MINWIQYLNLVCHRMNLHYLYLPGYIKFIFFLMGANNFWSTNISRRRDNCRIWLLCQGGLTFSDAVKKTHLENCRLEHPRPAPPQRQPTPPPLPPPHETMPSPKRLPRPSKSKVPKPASRMTLNSLLAGVTNKIK